MRGPPESETPAPARTGSGRDQRPDGTGFRSNPNEQQARRTEALALHIPLTEQHRERALMLGEQIRSLAISGIEATWRGSYPLALHHWRELDIALAGLLPLAQRLSDHVTKEPARRAS